MILVSACLLGLNTKYDGTSNENAFLLSYLRQGKFIPVCPEQLGGLPTPRPPVEINGGSGGEVLQGRKKIVSAHQEDYTQEFIKGAKEVQKIAQLYQVKAAILKERSPSCGVNQIYDGSFSHSPVSGVGVTAALLKKHNIAVYSEEELTPQLVEELLAQ